MTDLESRVFEYNMSLAAFRSLVVDEVMTPEEFVRISEMIAKNHGLSLCSIFFENR